MTLNDKSKTYFRTVEELYYTMGDLAKKRKSLPEFKLVIKGLMEKGYIEYVKGKGYTLSKFGNKETDRWAKEDIEKFK